MVLQFKNTTKITDRKLLMCAAYVFRSLYKNFGRGTHHIYIILHVAVFNSLLQFEIAMLDFPWQFFTCASICTSEFLRHTTISLIKLLKGIFLHSSIYFMFLATLSAFFWICHQLTTSRMVCQVCRVCQGLPRLAGFAGVRWVLSGLTRFTGGIRPNWHRVDSYLKFIPFHGEW